MLLQPLFRDPPKTRLQDTYQGNLCSYRFVTSIKLTTKPALLPKLGNKNFLNIYKASRVSVSSKAVKK